MHDIEYEAAIRLIQALIARGVNNDGFERLTTNVGALVEMAALPAVEPQPKLPVLIQVVCGIQVPETAKRRMATLFKGRHIVDRDGTLDGWPPITVSGSSRGLAVGYRISESGLTLADMVRAHLCVTTTSANELGCLLREKKKLFSFEQVDDIIERYANGETSLQLLDNSYGMNLFFVEESGRFYVVYAFRDLEGWPGGWRVGIVMLGHSSDWDNDDGLQIFFRNP
jgi:hypothetical protein